MTAVWVGIELAAVAPTIALHKSIPQDSNSAPAMQTDHLAVFAGKIDAKIYPVVTAHPFDALVEVTDAEGVAALCPCSRRTCPTRHHAEPYIEDSKRTDECRTLLRFNEPSVRNRRVSVVRTDDRSARRNCLHDQQGNGSPFGISESIS